MQVELNKYDLIMVVDSLEYMAELMKTMQKSTGYQPYTLDEINSMVNFLDGFYNIRDLK
tara:strand:- start:504 stop:680 length:177 start_codon:yes stop_codon:yes gene_type:complete